MKTFAKYFIITFVIFSIIFTATRCLTEKLFSNSGGNNKTTVGQITQPIHNTAVDPNSPYYAMFTQSKRINILLLGIDTARTDVNILVSYDPANKSVALISIPRDTYYNRAGYSDPTQKKINAVYQNDGAQGTENAVSKLLLGMPIYNYILIDYNGVGKIVDSLGGVKANIPMDMHYDDPYCKPPLHIRFNKGIQVLSGKNAIQFLRFRKNNNSTGYPEGDLGRIKAEQAFMKEALKKALTALDFL